METVWLLQVQGVTSEILGREAFKLCSHTKLKSKAKAAMEIKTIRAAFTKTIYSQEHCRSTASRERKLGHANAS